jgi:hypothetical protein
MLFTIIGNVVALGAVAALVSAVIKKDRASLGYADQGGEPDAYEYDYDYETRGTTAGRSS